jgi:DNA primase
MIEKARIEAVKQGVDLVALIKSRGIELKKNGKGYVGLCPFHTEETPSFSVNPSENLFQCFGCGVGGDPIRFVELFDKVSFPEAVEKLSAGTLPARPLPAADKQPAPLSVKEQKLLGRICAYYQHTLTQDSPDRVP